MIDDTIIAKAQSGDARALSELYVQLCTPVFRFVSYRVATREDAEDIAQDTMVAAIKNIGGYRGDARFLNWCYEIAKRKIADHWREHYKTDVIEWEESLPLATMPSDAETEHEHDAATQMLDAKVHAVLDQLPERYAEVLRYRFLHGYSLQETADAMNMTLTNAKVTQHRALKKASSLIYPQ